MSDSSKNIKRLSARLRGTVAEELPAQFSIKCECGSLVSGMRGKSWQQSTCSECHTILYLLPTNVYPTTDSVVNDVIGGTFSQRLRVVLSEALPRRKRKASEKSTSSPNQEATRTGSGKKLETTAGRGVTVKSPRWRIPKISLPRINPVEIARRTFTPIRLLILGMLLAVGMTSYWLYHRNQVDAADRVWREAQDAIPQLVAAGDFQALQQTLTNATDAGRLTGQEGPEWRRTVNLFEETLAVTNICYDTLPELLSEKAVLEASAVAAVMDQYFVIDGYIDPDGDDAGSFIVDIPAMSGQQSVRVTLQLPPLADYLPTNPTQRFVFAFRLQGSEQNNEFHELRVAPKSFVLFTSEEHCDQLGMSAQADPTLAEVLANQKAFVEESSRWEARRDELTQLARDAELRSEQ
jgi:hypothetical protein